MKVTEIFIVIEIPEDLFLIKIDWNIAPSLVIDCLGGLGFLYDVFFPQKHWKIFLKI